RGINSVTLAEILAHELGHTLGFAHSSDPRALMYASLQSLGPFLRDDDRDAARWLYPGPEGPAAASLEAPSNLQVASVTSENVRLRWTDNASAEVFQTIYYRPEGGAFAKLRDVGANVTVANVTGLAAGGTYEFQVTARRPAEESPASNVATAAVPRIALDASFTVAPPIGTAGITTFSFYDQSRGAIVSREWMFGDGATSSGANPTRVFAAAGTWEITLKVRDDRGAEAVATRSVTVSAPPALVADFAWASAAIAGQPLRFADRSAGAPLSWSWDFGDGTTSSERDPLKTFAAPGRHEISLRIESGLQSSAASKQIDIAAPQAGALTAEFEIAPDVPTAGRPVTFAESGPARGDRWRWDFGDGTASTEAQPTHVYEHSGTYLVTFESRRGDQRGVSNRYVVVEEGDPSSLVEDQAARPTVQ
ncbi:MAG TPA: PKD domain-containing protein, partial [Thermoanaerobaculia bacterium]|nr:PKD domain-containing protein [Thermoanaerobaculia bacterium]